MLHARLFTEYEMKGYQEVRHWIAKVHIQKFTCRLTHGPPIIIYLISSGEHLQV